MNRFVLLRISAIAFCALQVCSFGTNTGMAMAKGRRRERVAPATCIYENLKFDTALSRNEKKVYTGKKLSLVMHPLVDGKNASIMTDLGEIKCEMNIDAFKAIYHSDKGKKFVLQRDSGLTELYSLENCEVVEIFQFPEKVAFEKCRVKGQKSK